MPLQVFFSIGDELERDKDREGEIRPGSCRFFWGYRYPAASSPSSIIIAAVCRANDQSSEIFEFDHATATKADRGRPNELPYLPDEILLPSKASKVREVMNTEGYVGKLILVHIAHPGTGE